MTFVVRRVVPMLALAIIMGSIVRRQRLESASADTWFHLRFGSEFRSSWSIDNPGHLGRFDTADWVPTQWLSQLGMSWTYDVGGLDAVLWVSGLIQILLVAVVFLMCRARSTALAAAAATASCIIASAPGLSPRPQVISYLLVAVTLHAWLATADDKRPRWWLVGVTWLWAPLHGMWPIGIVVGGAAIIGMLLDRRLARAEAVRLAAVLAASCVAAVLTPLGVDVYRAQLAVGDRAQYFAEWGPTDFSSPYALITLLMVFGAIVFVARTKAPWSSLALVVLGAAFLVYSVRTTPVAAILAAPFIASALQHFLPEGAAPRWRERASLTGLVGLLLVVLAVTLGTRSQPAVVPPWLDDRLDALPADTSVLNDWNTGSWFLWRHPDLQLVMHGYGDVFTDRELERNADIYRLAEGWDVRVDALAADAAVVDPASSFGYALLRDDRWTVVEQDSDFALLLPSAPN